MGHARLTGLLWQRLGRCRLGWAPWHTLLCPLPHWSGCSAQFLCFLWMGGTQQSTGLSYINFVCLWHNFFQRHILLFFLQFWGQGLKISYFLFKVLGRNPSLPLVVCDGYRQFWPPLSVLFTVKIHPRGSTRWLKFLGSCYPSAETWTEFLAPGFGLVQTCLLRSSKEKTSGWKSSLP